MNEIRIQMNKVNSIQINNQVPVIKNTKAAIEFLRYQKFVMMTIEFDNYCFANASDSLRQKEYNSYMKRINKIAAELNMTIEAVENKIIKGETFPNHFVVVLVK